MVCVHFNLLNFVKFHTVSRALTGLNKLRCRNHRNDVGELQMYTRHRDRTIKNLRIQICPISEVHRRQRYNQRRTFLKILGYNFVVGSEVQKRMFNEFMMFSIGLLLGIYIGCYYFAPHPDPNEQVGLEWVGLMSLAVYMILSILHCSMTFCSNVLSLD